MAKKKVVFNELEWFAEHSEIIRDLLWCHLRNVEGWEGTTGIAPDVDLYLGPGWGPCRCKGTSISIAVGQSGFNIVLKAFRHWQPAQVISVEIEESTGQSSRSIGTFHHVYKGHNPIMNIRRIVEMTMYFITSEFVDYDRERFYPPKPPKPCPEAELNKDLWIYDEE